MKQELCLESLCGQSEGQEALLFGSCRIGRGNELSALFFKICGLSERPRSVQIRFAHMGRESGRGRIDISRPGGAADRLRFNRAIGVQLELHERILADAGGLAAIESINLPRAFLKRI